jgi:pimeloyl-ACP methyl ester carboxylesterase
VSNASVRTDGADIFYDVDGSGPVLLMIAGRGGTGGRYAGISAKLKDAYRVVRYDRRCCGRSTGDPARPMDLTQQANDAIAIISALGETGAYIFGNSAGASIALRLAEMYPRVPIGMIAHEPMTFSILPDREDWVEFDRRVDHVFRSEGTDPALKLLATSMVGMTPSAGASPPNRGNEDMHFFLDSEFMSLCYYRPDLDRIKRSGVNLIASRGRLSQNAYYARTADVVGEQVGCPVEVMSGNHIAHVLDPAEFAAELRIILSRLAGTHRTNATGRS